MHPHLVRPQLGLEGGVLKALHERLVADTVVLPPIVEQWLRRRACIDLKRQTIHEKSTP